MACLMHITISNDIYVSITHFFCAIVMNEIEKKRRIIMISY